MSCQPPARLGQLVAAVCEYWDSLSLFRDGQRWLERALAKQDEATATDRARLMIGYAGMLNGQGRFEEAEARLTEAVSLGEEVCDPLDRARALILYAAGLFSVGKYRDAEDPLREAHALAERLDDPTQRAAVAGRALANLSMCARGQADFARDTAYSEEALRLY